MCENKDQCSPIPSMRENVEAEEPVNLDSFLVRAYNKILFSLWEDKSWRKGLSQ